MRTIKDEQSLNLATKIRRMSEENRFLYPRKYNNVEIYRFYTCEDLCARPRVNLYRMARLAEDLLYWIKINDRRFMRLNKNEHDRAELVKSAERLYFAALDNALHSNNSRRYIAQKGRSASRANILKIERRLLMALVPEEKDLRFKITGVQR